MTTTSATENGGTNGVSNGHSDEKFDVCVVGAGPSGIMLRYVPPFNDDVNPCLSRSI
jgi:hypothetical protein